MNPCTSASERSCAAQRRGTVFWKDPPWRLRDLTRRLRRLVPLAFLILSPMLSRAQSNTIDLVSRELSVFNFGVPSTSAEAISREVSVFDFGQPGTTAEAISREVSLFDFGQPAYGSEAISREVSVFDFGQPGTTTEAISREVSLFDFGQPAYGGEAISREVSIFNEGFYSADTISREVSLFNYGYNHFNLAIGSTVVLAGNTGGVPVNFSTLVPVTNVQVAVDFPQNLLTNWSVQPQSPLTGTAFVSNNSRLYLTFSPASGQNIANTQQLGQISFTSASNQPSAFLPLPVAGATAPVLDGTTYTPYQAIQNGEVVVLDTNALLRAARLANGAEYLTLYGYSGTNYTIQSATNLAPPINWQTAYMLVPSNLIALTPNLPTTNPAIFYRAKQ